MRGMPWPSVEGGMRDLECETMEEQTSARCPNSAARIPLIHLDDTQGRRYNLSLL
jgi:hypothetical protein